MGLPDFLIIGARKSGTTWLYDVLNSHSEINMAKDRKEVHFFDRYYDRGVNWYEGKFPSEGQGIIGEATPDYLSESECALRIKEIIPEAKLICILRNPIDRAYSAYKYLVQEKNYKGSFEQAIKDDENILKRGLYYEQLNRYFNLFSEDNIKVLIFEKVLSDKKNKIKEICDFLEVSNDFNTNSLHKKSNVSKIPRLKSIYSIGKKLVRKLYDYDLVFLVNFMKKIGLKDVFFSNKKSSGFPPMTDEMRLRLREYYQNDIKKLEELLEKDLKSIWNFNS